ncbi:hypothetical protein CTA2_5541 [Colletotrichum tanaceti]|uniref:Uncharacterized protein n=1 Tax=Colletotrichum tanaceti TaxID=1306861 RepID=A0A4U6XFC0_9PEZI|nr:hypothetical protein CTA2_5541 [Colletotrichum tanaceti]TKW54550.1 hypothetical protein CTA1_2290 [Colletotrichum tanaceti]
MMEFDTLVLRPAAAAAAAAAGVAGGDDDAYYDSDMETEWIRTPSVDSLAGEDEIQVDPNGDLLLHVGIDPSSGDTKSFRVCSSTLRRASPFWKRTLRETSFESDRPRDDDGEWWAGTPSLYACQHDKSAGLAILLDIIHSRLHQVPEDPTLAEVYGTLCLASMYETERVLRPWLARTRWRRALERAETSRDGRDLGMLACLGWALGDERLFARTTVKIALTCVVDGEGRTRTADGVLLDDYLHDSLGSPVISESIRTLRNQLALDLPSHLNGLIGRLMEGKWLCVGIADIPITRDKKCDYVVLGSVFAGLAYVRGTRTAAVAIGPGESVTDLLKSLRRVLSYVTCYERHAECNPAEGIADAMRRTVDEMDLPLSTECIRRMREQRQKFGLEQKE